MKLTKLFIMTFSVLALAACEQTENTSTETTTESRPEYAVVIHGGAGTIRRENMTPEQDAEYRAAMGAALAAAETELAAGNSALDAVVAAINLMEDSPLFNAGHGAVFTNAGTNELDSSIMDGATMNSGAVAGVTHVKNPITLARAVMENSPHVMLAGTGAETFAEENGIELVDPDYFYTERRWNALQRALGNQEGYNDVIEYQDDRKFGTVGVVALDKNGNLAAGTSTGGMTNKRWGRIGDSPIIGAGTYASNNSCGVSATGAGEYFIRATVARSICALVEYKGLSLNEAANQVIFEDLSNLGGTGGIIAMDPMGNIAMTFNTEGMYRGYVIAGEDPVVGIYKDE